VIELRFTDRYSSLSSI